MSAPPQVPPHTSPTCANHLLAQCAICHRTMWSHAVGHLLAGYHELDPCSTLWQPCRPRRRALLHFGSDWTSSAPPHLPDARDSGEPFFIPLDCLHFSAPSDATKPIVTPFAQQGRHVPPVNTSSSAFTDIDSSAPWARTRLQIRQDTFQQPLLHSYSTSRNDFATSSTIMGPTLVWPTP